MKDNNRVIAYEQSLYRSAHLERFVIREAPIICVKLYLDGILGLLNGSDVDDLLVDELDAFDASYSLLSHDAMLVSPYSVNSLKEAEAIDVPSLTTLIGKYNITEIGDIPRFLEFMARCGDNIDKETERSSVVSFLKNMTNLGNSGSVSFNWIICPTADRNETGARTADNNAWTAFMKTFRLPDDGHEAEYALNRWKEQRLQLFTEYQSLYETQPNMTQLQARYQSFRDATSAADGFESCIPDTVAAAWFWFVVMTTIGYGDSYPRTTGGRILVYTFGFFSILLFGWVMAEAGDIITEMFKDGVSCTKD